MTNLPAKVSSKYAVSDLWNWNGQITRSRYLTWGASLFGLKYLIDLGIAELIFHRAWSPLNYIAPGQALDFLAMSPADRSFFIAILLLALPFIWSGIVLTMRRLRDAGFSVFWAKLFFMPFVNFILFFLLCVFPTRTEDPETLMLADGSKIQQLEQMSEASKTALPSTVEQTALSIPEKRLPLIRSDEPLAAATFSIVSTVPVAILFSWFGVFMLQQYGWGLFVGIPFVLGLSSASIFGRSEQRSLPACLGVAGLSIVLLGVGIFCFAWEGMGCLLMASPIALVLALMGAMLGWAVQRRRPTLIEQKFCMLGLLVLMPGMMGAEYVAAPQAPLSSVTSTIEIAAPPEEVWKHIIAFPMLPPPKEFWFKYGIAYPIGATITGTGRGAVRHCNFSTGSFVEPITTWDEPRLLGFNVVSQPASMREWSWMHDIQPAHLHGYLQVERGQFRLVPINRSGQIHTMIVGTTWYLNKMWPNVYWRMWCDGLIHSIHMRVLEHIKQQSEHTA